MDQLPKRAAPIGALPAAALDEVQPAGAGRREVPRVREADRTSRSSTAATRGPARRAAADHSNACRTQIERSRPAGGRVTLGKD
jgi:hypothetical protein